MTEGIAISLRNVSKVYKRYHQPVDRLKEILLPGKPRAEEFWALQDINLEILQGESLGIIGRNGSGKSTLLQIIAGTLTPTTGEIQVSGRMSALLELGSGFNPEFTGRQNVFFNGRLLGLTQEEVESKFDQIAAFADIDDFLDQPVKTYSSGMFVRLAFSVAVNVDPQILIVDEALAVGDIFFQQKCFGKMRQLKESGRNLLFVSHDSSAVYKLCNRAVLLENGRLILDSKPRQVIDLYEARLLKEVDQDPSSLDVNVIFENKRIKGESDREDEETEEASENVEEIKLQRSEVTIQSVQLLDSDRKATQTLITDQSVKLVINIQFHKAFEDPHVGFKIRDRTGLDIFVTNTYLMSHSLSPVKADQCIEVSFDFCICIIEGDYTVTVGVADGGYEHGMFNTILAYVHNVLPFKVVRDIAKPIWFGVANLNPKLTVNRIQPKTMHSRWESLDSRPRDDLENQHIKTPIDTSGNSNGELSSNVSQDDQSILKCISEYTMTSTERQTALVDAVRYIVRRGISGCIVECGVWRGGSMMATALTLMQEGDETRELYLFDTFEGMTPPTDVDRTTDGTLAKSHLEMDEAKTGYWCYASLEDVKANMKTTNYPEEKIHFIKGPVEQTIPSYLPSGSIALLRLDTDWYESTRHEMMHLFPLLVEGGVLIIDDYGHWEGARKAVDEFLASQPRQFYLHRIDYTGRLLINQ